MQFKSMVNKKKLTLDELVIAIRIPRKTILDWEKRSLIESEKSPDGQRFFNLKLVCDVRDKLSGKGELRRFKVLKSEPTNYTAVELFSGAGGLALGLSNAGFQTKLLVEFDKDAVATLKQNRPGWNVVHDDIKNVDFRPYEGKIDVVAGGFPCQTFSFAGNGQGFGDTRGTLFFEFARCVSEIRPKIALAENVRGLLPHDNGRTLETILYVMRKALGYRVGYKVLSAQFYDVAQKRERLFIVGLREDLDTSFLFPTPKDYIMTLQEALDGCPASEGAIYPERKRFIMSKVPEGGNWRDLSVDLQKEHMRGSFHLGGGKTGMARRLSMKEPSLTLVCSPAQGQTERCHPKETRPLAIREYARIQSFPDSWNFSGSLGSQYKQIGNAVPVNLAYHVGRCLIAMLSGKPEKDAMVLEAKPEKQIEFMDSGLHENRIKEFALWISSTKPQEAESCRL